MATSKELKVLVTGDASKLTSALDGAEKKVTSFSDGLVSVGKVATIAGGVITGAFAAIILKTAEVDDQFDKMSIRTGVSVEALSALAYAADITGTSIDTVEIGLKGLTTSMDDASNGIGLGKEAFDELDISVVDFEGDLRPTIDVLKEAATKIAEIDNPTKQAALAMDLFGSRAGPKLLPLLKQGEGGINDLMEKAKELNGVISTESATAGADFTDRMNDLKVSLAGVGRTIGDILIPAVTPFIEKATEIVGKITEWAEENETLVTNLTKWGGILGVVLLVLGPIAVILPSLIAGVTLLSGAFLPFLITGAIIAGVIKLNSLLDDMNEKVYKDSISLSEMTVGSIDAEVELLTQKINSLGKQIEIASSLPLASSAQHGGVIDMQNAIDNYKKKLEWLKEARAELTGEEEKGIDVTDKLISLDEEAAKILATLTDAQTEQEKALKKLTEEKALANAEAELEAKTYELTDTAIEGQIRSLYALATKWQDAGADYEEVAAYVELATEAIYAQNEEIVENVDNMEEVAKVTKAVEDRWFELTKLPYEVKLKEINERYDDYIKVIKDSTLSTSAQETAIRNINLARDLEVKGVDKVTDAEKKAEEEKQDLADAYDNIKDKILELKDPRAAAIQDLDDERQRLIDLGVNIELVNELYDLEIEKLGEVGDAFTLFETVAQEATQLITGYIVDELGTAIYNLWNDLDDEEVTWANFWEGLWNAVEKWASQMIAKLLVLIPILAAVAFFTGGISWAKIIEIASFVGIGFDKGGKVKGFADGGTTDTIPAMLTPGEYVIAKPMTDFIRNFGAIPGNLVNAISGGMPTPTPAFAGGGLVGGGSDSGYGSYAGGSSAIYVDIHDNRISDDIDIRRLASTVSDEILRKINMNRRH